MHPRSVPESEILELAARQHHIVSAAQLRTLGVGRGLVHRRVASGAWASCLPGVYAVGPGAHQLGYDGWCSAAVLSAPQPAGISHECAARRWGAWDRGSDEIHVLAPTRREDIFAGGRRIRFHRSETLPTHDLVLVEGVATTAFGRTLLDLGAHLTEYQLAYVMHRAAFLGLLDLVDVLYRLELRHGWPWSRVVRRAIDLHRSGSAGTRSATEDRFLARWLALGLPEPAVNVPGSVGIAGIETDLAWCDRRLVVEIDGARAHDRPNDLARDPQRDAAVMNAGWRVLRIPGSDVWADVESCVARVRAAW